jgi:probable rRNA maturation factor
MIRIAITDRQKALKIDRRTLRRAATRALKLESVAAGRISLVFVDDAEMRALNARHLGHDYPTDVLSFLLDVGDAEPLTGKPGRWIEAEIIVSGDTAVRQAPRYGWSPYDELTLYVVHGLLHACGYDDHSPRDKVRMRRREREVLETLGFVIPGNAG